MSIDNNSDTIINNTMTASAKNSIRFKAIYSNEQLPAYEKERPSVEDGLAFGSTVLYDRADVLTRIHANGLVLIANDQAGGAEKNGCVVLFYDASNELKNRIECPANGEFAKVEDAYQIDDARILFVVHSVGEEARKVVSYNVTDSSTKTLLTDLDDEMLHRFRASGDEELYEGASTIELNVDADVVLSQSSYSDMMDRCQDNTFAFLESLGGNGVGNNAAMGPNDEYLYISLTDQPRTRLDILKVPLGESSEAMSRFEKNLEFPDNVRVNPTPRIVGLTENGDYRLTWQAPNSDSVQCSTMSPDGEMLDDMSPCNPSYDEVYRVGDYTEYEFVGDKVIFPLYGPTHFYLIQLDANLGSGN